MFSVLLSTRNQVRVMLRNVGTIEQTEVDIPLLSFAQQQSLILKLQHSRKVIAQGNATICRMQREAAESKTKICRLKQEVKNSKETIESLQRQIDENAIESLRCQIDEMAIGSLQRQIDDLRRFLKSVPQKSFGDSKKLLKIIEALFNDALQKTPLLCSSRSRSRWNP